MCDLVLCELAAGTVRTLLPSLATLLAHWWFRAMVLVCRPAPQCTGCMQVEVLDVEIGLG